MLLIDKWKIEVCFNEDNEKKHHLKYDTNVWQSTIVNYFLDLFEYREEVQTTHRFPKIHWNDSTG